MIGMIELLCPGSNYWFPNMLCESIVNFSMIYATTSIEMELIIVIEVMKRID